MSQCELILRRDKSAGNAAALVISRLYLQRMQSKNEGTCARRNRRITFNRQRRLLKINRCTINTLLLVKQHDVLSVKNMPMRRKSHLESAFLG